MLVVSGGHQLNGPLKPGVFHVGDNKQGFRGGSIQQRMKLIVGEFKRTRAFDTWIGTPGLATLYFCVTAVDDTPG